MKEGRETLELLWVSSSHVGSACFSCNEGLFQHQLRGYCVGELVWVCNRRQSLGKIQTVCGCIVLSNGSIAKHYCFGCRLTRKAESLGSSILPVSIAKARGPDPCLLQDLQGTGYLCVAANWDQLAPGKQVGITSAQQLDTKIPGEGVLNTNDVSHPARTRLNEGLDLIAAKTRCDGKGTFRCATEIHD